MLTLHWLMGESLPSLVDESCQDCGCGQSPLHEQEGKGAASAPAARPGEFDQGFRAAMVICVCTEGILHCNFQLTLVFRFALKVLVRETGNLNTHRKSGDLLSKGSFQI